MGWCCSRLAEHGRLHAVVEDLAWRAAEVLEGLHVTAQHGRQVLVQDELCPQVPAVAEHHGEQPDLALTAGLGGELDAELGEVDLRLTPGRRLEADLEVRRRQRPHLAQEVVEPPSCRRGSQARGSRAAIARR